MNEKLRRIINHYGVKKQLKYFQSEIFELNEAIIQYEERKRNPIDIVCNALEPIMASMNNRKAIKSTDEIKGEIADVMVMLKQIQLNYNISTEEVKEVMKSKIDRQLQRINEEVK
jgi:NTP pyrophosphatase (non-canonical NTP hydrolase)